MKVKLAGIEGSTKAVQGFVAGMETHNDEYELYSLSEAKKQRVNGFIQTNLLKPKFSTKDRSGPYEYILDSQKPFLVQESPSFRRYTTNQDKWARWGWYSYKWDEAIWGNENSPNDRWNVFSKKLGISLTDWNSPGDKIIIIGQKPSDSSLTKLLNNGKTFHTWLQDTVTEIRKYSDREIVIRPHPRGFKDSLNQAKRIKGKNISISQNVSTVRNHQGGDGLLKDFKNAHCVITYNSLSAVESVCDGIPTFALDGGSMAWPVTHHNLSTIENLDYSINRQQWCNDIAYTQWSPEEQQNGTAWAHLKPLVFSS